MSRKYKVLVLGGTGMLGHAVVTRLREMYPPESIAFTATNQFPPYKDHPKGPIYGFKVGPMFPNMPAVGQAEYVINCIGMIKPRCKTLNDYATAAYVNGSFPCLLADLCRREGTKLIHITTDCIYSGLRDQGSYTEADAPDVVDGYGLSKAIGDLCSFDALVLRTSIIGTEPNNQTSLVEWVRKQDGKKIQGYTNHRWNGVTTTEFANICIKIIDDHLWRVGLHHIPSPEPISKWALVWAIAKQLKVGVQVEAVQVETTIDRTLSTIFPGFYYQLNIRSLKEQIETMPDFNPPTEIE